MADCDQGIIYYFKFGIGWFYRLLFFKTKWFKFLFWYNFIEFFTLKPYGGVKAARQWKRLKRKAQTMIEESRQEIVVKAHQILDKLLERLVPVYQADSFSTRLAYINGPGGDTFSNSEEIWWAHELYRSLARVEQHIVSKEELEKVVQTYDQAFKDLGII